MVRSSSVRIAAAFAAFAALAVLAPRSGAGGLSTNADIFEEVPVGSSTQIDISARAAGMGGAATAVPWGDLDHWANPALLGDAQGIRYVHGTTPWSSFGGSDATFTSDVVQAGAFGFGGVLSGEPFDAGGATLDQGRIDLSAGSGTLTLHPRDHVRGWGVGLRVLEALGNGVPAAARWSRTADVSVGYMHKHTEEDPGTELLLPSSALTHDWGVLAQLTPLDGFRDGGNDVAVAFAGGYSDINASGRSDDEPAVTVFRQRRKGVSARFAAGRGPVLRPFTAGLTPLVTAIASYDHADLGSSTVVESRTDGGGVELTLMNVFALRAGRFSRTGGPGAVHDATYGWGLALPIGEFGGVAYDEGRWPESDDRDPLHRRQFAVWLDPFAVWRAASGSDEAHAAP